MRSEKYIYGVASITGLVSVLFVFGVLYIEDVGSRPLAAVVAAESRDVSKEESVSSVVPDRLYLPQPLVARAAVVLDASTGRVLYGLRHTESMPIASITKVMTSLAALSVINDADTVRITSTAASVEGFDSLVLNEAWRAGSLADYMLLTSSNKAAAALREAAHEQLQSRGSVSFIEYMNHLASRIGMNATTFTNETGLDVDDTHATNFGSAHDVAKLFAYVLQNSPRILEATDMSEIQVASHSRLHLAKNTNKALDAIPGFIAGKTGFTDAAGGNLAIVFDVEPGRPIGVVVLGSGKEERFDDVIMLVQAVRDAYGMSVEKQVRLPL